MIINGERRKENEMKIMTVEMAKAIVENENNINEEKVMKYRKRKYNQYNENK